MKRRLVSTGLLPLIGLLITAGPAEVNAADPVSDRLENSPRHQEWVDVAGGGDRTVRCFVVYPEVSDKALTVIVIHENKGLTDWVRSVADAVAEKGFLAIAPDFLSGTGPGGGGTEAYDSTDAATRGIYALKDEQVMADLDAVAKHVPKIEAANGKFVTMGFCWGGGKSFAYAAHNPELSAALVFYGSAPEASALEKIKAPVYGFYGENDARITGQVPRVAETMKKLGKTYEPVVYEGVGHGFMRMSGQEGATAADRKAVEEVRSRVKKILSGIK